MAWDEEDNTVYAVVVNEEEQYSIWPEHKQIPGGWRSVGRAGSKADCLDFIRQVWIDMRPLSLRRRMQEASPPRS
ncbi:MbtH family NRPS accessory protein [Methylosinus sp. Ce-a6]|uniref:MbtH family protein n=1 Tax=Methylosinus sp. Ce-a6 TaxID=2172005 RepID=UPI00135B058D|nr:MbtH family NRPS accessory protein [Methylosinus sp. Ce-a6]